MNKPLRILMIIHTPWSRDLGAPRTQIELAEEWRRAGHTVEKFSREDAFPAPQSRLASELMRFSSRATDFVRKHGADFDIIDANQTDLLLSKKQLNFQGLLVARSVGLIPVYADYFLNIWDREQSPAQWKWKLWRIWERYKAHRSIRESHRSFQNADVINVSNHDDLEWMRARIEYGKKTVCLPFGLTEKQWTDFRVAAVSPSTRHAEQRVVFIGSWDVRKGSQEWPGIFSELKKQKPGARLRLLGTSQSAETILSAFAPEWRKDIEVIPTYRNEDLPVWLSDATVGAFPSHLEGFGYAVLEKLAAGLPVVAYDAPGAREMLHDHPAGTLVPVGDVGAFAGALAERLDTPLLPSLQGADFPQFVWSRIAAETLAYYVEALEKLRS